MDQEIKQWERLVYKVLHEKFPYFTIHQDMKEDYISAGMIGLYKGLSSYNPSKGKQKTYLYRCIFNEVVNHKEKEKTRYKNEQELNITHIDEGGETDTYVTVDDVDSLNKANELLNFIKTLPERERVVVERIIRGDKQREIANDLGVTVQMVSLYLKQARQKITIWQQI